MVRLHKIYTRGGDGGQTSLADGTRVSKNSPRMVVQGDIDEANATVGLARLHADADRAEQILKRVQNDLFDLGADVSTPGENSDDDSALRIRAQQVARLETEVDEITTELAPLESFVLRGGTALAAHLHYACTVVRRAERALVDLAAAEPINPQALAYLNRLSDLLFVLARTANAGGNADILWQPGLTQG